MEMEMTTQATTSTTFVVPTPTTETQVWTKAFTTMHTKFEKWCETVGVEMIPSKTAFQPTRRRNSNKIQEFIMANSFTKDSQPISSTELFILYETDNPTPPPKSPKAPKSPKFVCHLDTDNIQPPKVDWSIQTESKDFDYVETLDGVTTEALVTLFGEPQKTGDQDDFWTYEWKVTFNDAQFSIFDWVQNNPNPHTTTSWNISWDSCYNEHYDAFISLLESSTEQK